MCVCVREREREREREIERKRERERESGDVFKGTELEAAGEGVVAGWWWWYPFDIELLYQRSDDAHRPQQRSQVTGFMPWCGRKS